jgi:hypothetical protein
VCLVGFGDPLLLWFGSYIHYCKQFVSLLGEKSDIIDVPSGVPQEGHLSLLLFAIFINGMEEFYC